MVLGWHMHAVAVEKGTSLCPFQLVIRPGCGHIVLLIQRWLAAEMRLQTV